MILMMLGEFFSKKINGLKSILQYDDSLNLASNI